MGKILVTGGLGYIGSHTVVALHESGYSVLIVDDLSNSERDVLKGLDEILGFTPEFMELDLRDKSAVNNLLMSTPSME